MKIRGFEKIKDIAILPFRSTSGSAGYDFSLIEDVVFKPQETKCIKTYIKAYMQKDEYLSIHIRSSLGVKKGLQLMNQTGIVDSDYYNNIDNEGHIMIFIKNESNESVALNKGDKFAQGIFTKYLLVDDDDTIAIRDGGFGSTN